MALFVHDIMCEGEPDVAVGSALGDFMDNMQVGHALAPGGTAGSPGTPLGMLLERLPRYMQYGGAPVVPVSSPALSALLEVRRQRIAAFCNQGLEDVQDAYSWMTMPSPAGPSTSQAQPMDALKVHMAKDPKTRAQDKQHRLARFQENKLRYAQARACEQHARETAISSRRVHTCGWACWMAWLP